jgi:inner membrane protease subunit 1
MVLVADKLVQVRLAEGPSMMPMLDHSNNIILIDMLTLGFRAIKHGEIIMSKSMVEPDWVVCKQVMALPGNIVCTNPSKSEKSLQRFIKVPLGKVWIQGDNLDFSRDSRTFGPVSINMIQGRVFYRASHTLIC